jgi:2-oxoglutarate dehydrogenase E2 component (dihydrolipoamide succinyltransferase)
MSKEQYNLIYAPPIAGATIAAWHKKPGDYFKANETIADIDKWEGVYEISIPKNGILKEILVPVGSDVDPNQVIATYTVMGIVAKLKNFIKRKQ